MITNTISYFNLVAPKYIPKFCGDQVDNDSAIEFFGATGKKEISELGLARFRVLKRLMQKQISFVDLGRLECDNPSNYSKSISKIVDKLSEFKDKKLAILTLKHDVYRHTNVPNAAKTHSIALLINEDPNTRYIYNHTPELIVLNSNGENNPAARKFPDEFKMFLQDYFPGYKVTYSEVPQQIDGSFTCSNWRFANLEALKPHLGEANILQYMPKASEQAAILKKHKKLVQNTSPQVINELLGGKCSQEFIKEIIGN